MSLDQPNVVPNRDAPEVPELSANRGRLIHLVKIAVFDLVGPLVTYSVLRSSGFSSVSALILSGVVPSFGVLLGVARDRRVDIFGILVLAGIAVGTALGLVSGNARLLLLESSVPTAVFGTVCIGSLWSARPLMYRFAIEFIGADTPKGASFADKWRYEGFRHAFRVTTVVWGVAYFAEAIARVIIVESTSTGTALALSKMMPYGVAVVLAVWNVNYGRRAHRRGERLGAAAHERGEVVPSIPS